MSQMSVKLLISFDALVESLAALNLREKRKLWAWLGEQITPDQMRENRSSYAASNLATEEGTTPQDIVEQLKKLTPADRLAVVERALHLIREDLRQVGQGMIAAEQKQQLALAAKTLLPDYTTDDELTGFTTLDGEEFYEAR